MSERWSQRDGGNQLCETAEHGELAPVKADQALASGTWRSYGREPGIRISLAACLRRALACLHRPVQARSPVPSVREAVATTFKPSKRASRVGRVVQALACPTLLAHRTRGSVGTSALPGRERRGLGASVSAHLRHLRSAVASRGRIRFSRRPSIRRARQFSPGPAGFGAVELRNPVGRLLRTARPPVSSGEREFPTITVK